MDDLKMYGESVILDEKLKKYIFRCSFTENAVVLCSVLS